MTKKEQKAFALKLISSAINSAYYRLENFDISDSDNEAILVYLNEYGKRACKAVGVRYVTY